MTMKRWRLALLYLLVTLAALQPQWMTWPMYLIASVLALMLLVAIVRASPKQAPNG